jgi:hypothetical protein
MRSERRPWAPLALALLTVAGLALAQDGPEQLVWLKNGGFLRGSLLELSPNDHVTVKLLSGEVRRVPFAEIERTQTAGSPPTPSSAAAPATSAPAAPATSAPAPATSAPAAPATSARHRLDSAPVKLLMKGEGAVVLESRPRHELLPWLRECDSPCGGSVLVVDREFRVRGENMPPSLAFVVDPSEVPVKLEVKPGSDVARRWGLVGLLGGAPLVLLGGAGFGVGVGTSVKGHDAIGTAGLITLIVGGLATIASLPLLSIGQTRVRTPNGEAIGLASPPASQRF